MVINSWSLRLDLDLRSSLGRRSHPDAVIVQDDRNLVMGGQSILDLDDDSDTDSIYAECWDHRPLPLGEFLVFRGRGPERPWTYQAVVHDLEQTPSCRPGDVRRSLCGVVKDAEERGIETLATEPLGRWRSRGLSLEEMTDAFDQSVFEMAGKLESSIRIILMFDDMDQLEEASHLLRSRVLSRSSRSFRTVNGEWALAEVRDRDEKFHFRFVPGTLSGYIVSRVEATG